MAEAINKALLRTGYNLHIEFEKIIAEIEKNQQQWAEIIEQHFDKCQYLIKEYHKVAFEITTHTKQNGIPDYLKNSSSEMLEIMDNFNDEILDYDNFLDNIHHPKNLIILIHQVNKTNNLLRKLKNKIH
ncbi:hypothetical protein [Lactobacillus sp. PSON]|uniref:hypothetical protein n=1 Tax=Lactobacillus sp. PSON TaxID=3455454 RepID=UPI004042E280